MISIFSDGSCAGNPGPGGWAALVVKDGRQELVEGGELHTTNNRMELMGAIGGLESAPAGSTVTLTTDSKYVQDGIEKYIHNWKRNGWRTAAKAPVKNQDLWERLDAACSAHTVKWAWVKGHNGHLENEIVDKAAQAQTQIFAAETRRAAAAARRHSP